jgi:hypothetical protein
MMTSWERLSFQGAHLREVAEVDTTEKFFVVGNLAPALIIGYRVRNTGSEDCSVRVLRSLTSQTYDTGASTEWTELVAAVTVSAAAEINEIVDDTIAMGVALGITSASGTDVIVEILVAK